MFYLNIIIYSFLLLFINTYLFHLYIFLSHLKIEPSLSLSQISIPSLSVLLLSPLSYLKLLHTHTTVDLGRSGNSNSGKQDGSRSSDSSGSKSDSRSCSFGLFM